jgi:hypothetical protein
MDTLENRWIRQCDKTVYLFLKIHLLTGFGQSLTGRMYGFWAKDPNEFQL